MGYHTTRYQYYYTQSVSNLNEGWLADPIATMGAASVARSGGANVAQDVEEGIRTGAGMDLVHFYQYATKRFKKRNVTWSLRQVFQSAYELTVISEKELKALDPSIGTRPYRIVQEDRVPVLGGIKFLADMQKKYGLDYFHDTDSRGNSVAINTLTSASTQIRGTKYNTWIVGTENSSGYKSILLVDPREDVSQFSSSAPFYVLDTAVYEPEKSVGIAYWISNTSPTVVVKDEERMVHREDSDVFENLRKPEYVAGTVLTISKQSNWITDEFDGEGKIVYDISEVVDSTPKPEALQAPVEVITYKKLEIIGTTSKRVSVRYWTEVHTVTYDEEKFLYATKSENPTIWDMYNKARAVKELGDVNFNSGRDKRLFKLFPYLPVKEYWTDVFDTSKAQKLKDAYKLIDEKTKDKPEDETRKEEDAPKANRAVAKKSREREKDIEIKKAQRVIQRGGKYKRNVTVTDKLDYKSGDKRHLIQMGKYLGTDPREISLANSIQEASDKIFFNSLQPATKLATNFDVMEKYNRIFFKKLMKALGDGGYSKFEAALKANFAKNKGFNPEDLPRYEFDYHAGQLHGRISFCYIKEFKMKGVIRKTKRVHRIQETRRGKLDPLYSKQTRWVRTENMSDGGSGSSRLVPEHFQDLLYSPEETINRLLNPPRELAEDKYFTTETGGKQYNIGGDPERTDVIHTMEEGQKHTIAQVTLSSFGYTFFCKQVTVDTIEVIAVAGLVGGFRGNHENYVEQNLNASWLYSSAYNELGMLYERNKLKYVEKTALNKIDVSTQISHGGKRYKTINKVQNFFVIPLDLRSAMKLGGADLTRFAGRAIWQHQWTHTETHSKNLGFIKTIVTVVSLIVAIILATPSGGGSLAAWASATATAMGTSAFWVNLVSNLVIAQLISLAVSKGIALLSKLLGLKGFLALIVAVVVAVIAAYAGGFDMNQSAMPYASEVASKQVATEVAKTTTQSMASTVVKTIGQEVAKITYKDIAKTLLIEGGTALGSQMQEQNMAKLQSAMEQEQKLYNSAMSKLEEKQEGEKLTGLQYDVKEVLKALNVRIKAQDPSTFYSLTTMDVNSLCGMDYLTGFLQSKLSLELTTFDPVSSLNFSTKLNQSSTVGGV